MKKFRFLISCFLILSTSCTDWEPEFTNEGEDWSFVVFSDLQQGYGRYSRLAEIIGKLEPVPLAAVCCGDIMLRSANEAEWITFLDCSEPITTRMPLLIARGNHEGNDASSESILNEMGKIPGPPFYYTSRFKDALFIILDTEIAGQEGSIGEAQLNWLANTLDSSSSTLEGLETPSRVFMPINDIFIFMHHPLYQQGQHEGLTLANAGELHSLFTKYPKVRMVFAGHDHMFHKMKKDGILYVITGGGGGTLEHGYGGDYHHFVKVSFFENPRRINIKTIGVYYEVVEDFDL